MSATAADDGEGGTAKTNVFLVFECGETTTSLTVSAFDERVMALSEFQRAVLPHLREAGGVAPRDADGGFAWRTDASGQSVSSFSCWTRSVVSVLSAHGKDDSKRSEDVRVVTGLEALLPPGEGQSLGRLQLPFGFPQVLENLISEAHDFIDGKAGFDRDAVTLDEHVHAARAPAVQDFGAVRNLFRSLLDRYRVEQILAASIDDLDDTSACNMSLDAVVISSPEESSSTWGLWSDLLFSESAQGGLLSSHFQVASIAYVTRPLVASLAHIADRRGAESSLLKIAREGFSRADTCLALDVSLSGSSLAMILPGGATAVLLPKIDKATAERSRGKESECSDPDGFGNDLIGRPIELPHGGDVVSMVLRTVDAPPHMLRSKPNSSRPPLAGVSLVEALCRDYDRSVDDKDFLRRRILEIAFSTLRNCYVCPLASKEHEKYERNPDMFQDQDESSLGVVFGTARFLGAEVLFESETMARARTRSIYSPVVDLASAYNLAHRGIKWDDSLTGIVPSSAAFKEDITPLGGSILTGDFAVLKNMHRRVHRDARRQRAKALAVDDSLFTVLDELKVRALASYVFPMRCITTNDDDGWNIYPRLMRKQYELGEAGSVLAELHQALIRPDPSSSMTKATRKQA